MIKFLDKEPQHDVIVRVPAFTRSSVPFYGCRADDVNDDAFVIGEAITKLNGELGTMQDVGDALTPAQSQFINDLFDRFKAEIGYVEDKKAVKALQLENGRLRAKIGRLEDT